jgi:hypothetical protein
VFKRNNKPGDRFLVQKYHSIGTLHVLLGQNMKNKKSQSRAALRDFAQLLRATRCWDFLGFHTRCYGHRYEHDPLYYRKILNLLVGSRFKQNIPFLERFSAAKYLNIAKNCPKECVSAKITPGIDSWC